MKPEYESLSLFDMEAAPCASTRDVDLLPVARMAFMGSETMAWETLFDGFDTLNAVTYTTGMEFLCALVKRVEWVEVVFGYEGVEFCPFALHEVWAYHRAAFSGRQRENICCLDDEAAYEWYKESYDALWEGSTDEISARAFAVVDDAGHADEVPIAGTS